MDKDKQISVVVCTYNGAKYLRPQLDSIIGQTLRPCEIIIQDDGSTDDTWNILEEYAQRQPCIRLFRNEGKHGINHNFFSAMRKATCEYIALSDQDDIWEKDKLKKQAEAIGKRLLCSGFSVPFSDDGFPVGNDLRQPNYDILRIAYLGVLPGHTLFMHKSLLDYLKGNEDCPYLYDWQLQMVAAAAESIAFVPDTLVHFRRHVGAATASSPVGNSFMSRSTIHYMATTLFCHTSLQSCVRKRFGYILQMLDELPFQTKSGDECHKMAVLQTRRGLVNFIRRTFFFLHHRTRLFYTVEKDSLFTVCRALYFSFSCGYYYRATLKQKK